jgi:leucyl-tRNA synthetase
VREGFGILLRVLYRDAPALAHELWHALGYARIRRPARRPFKVDENAQGRDRAGAESTAAPRLGVSPSHRKPPPDQNSSSPRSLCGAAAGATPKKVIVVPGRLVNVVI